MIPRDQLPATWRNGCYTVRPLHCPSATIFHTAGKTAQYCAPEVIKSHIYDRPTDVWALGCIVHEMCTLQMAFDGPNTPYISGLIV